MPESRSDEGAKVYTQQSPEALSRLLSAHLPHSLALLRRLQFTKFPGGITEHARILYASDVTLSPPPPPLDPGVAPDEAKAAAVAMQVNYPFTAAYLDISRGPETQMWIYSTMERHGGRSDDGGSGNIHRDNNGDEKDRRTALRHTASILRAARRIRDDAVTGLGWSASPLGPCILAGSLSETLRTALRDEFKIAFPHVGLYDKWLLDVREMPSLHADDDDARNDKEEPGLLEAGMRRTVKLLPSMGIMLENSTPIAWCFLGPDGSLSSMHCEGPYRGRGFAKAVVAKLLRHRLRDYGGDDSTLCCADVASDNLGSQGVCRSLGGTIGWTVSWSTIDLDTVPVK
ncbi:Acetyltransferase [Apiospora kogelbergensis]|uniref:Acetyltransferase n=1 Tax=Apiospora kogelbergensis TaxID=1337665 RepID=A0AAW0QB32_9PEZI